MRWIFALLLILAATLARPADAQSCVDMEIDQAAGAAGQLTTLLQVANFRADVKYMGEIALELEQFLETCGDEETGRLALVCDYRCHLQLGRYYLFLAAELPFLSSAGGVARNDTPLSPQEAQEQGQNGIETVDRGLRILARQQGGEGDDGGEASYRNFVRQLVALNSLKISLYMNTGDVWYQTVSEARIKALDFMIVSSLGATSDSGLESQPNLAKANTYYETALWTLVETQMDVPGESTYDDLRIDLALLQTDLQARLGSVRRGFLFLNIDPLQFTTIPFEELQSKLAETQRDLDLVEQRVEVIVERWQANQLGEATRHLDEQRTIRSQRVNLIAHQIGKLEQEAAVFANSVQQEINEVDAERDTFGFRQQIRNLEIQLATKIAEFENQRRQLQQRSELDLLVLSKEAEIERRNELRWLLNWEMTQMNLDLQISSLESQIAEYGRQTARNLNQLEQNTRQRDIIRTQIANAEAGVEQANERIVEIELRSIEVYRKRRLVSLADVCSIENQLAFIGDPMAEPFAPGEPGETPCQTVAPAFTRLEYQTQMCGADGNSGLRAKLFGEQIEARAFMMECVVGAADFQDLQEIVPGSDLIDPDIDLPSELGAVDCGTFSQSETDFAREIYEAEKAALEVQADAYAETAAQLDSQINEVIAWAIDFDGTVIAAQTGLTIAETALATAALAPKTTVAAAGLASGVYTTIEIDKTAAYNVNLLRSILSTIIQVGRTTQATMNQIDALNRQLTQNRQANTQLDKQKVIKALALNRAHFQLAGQRASGIAEIKELVLQTSMAALDCQSADLNIDEQVARLNADHRRLIAALDLMSSENDLLSFQVAEQQRTIERLTNEIGILNLELEKLTLAGDQLVDDNARIAELVSAVTQRIARVGQVRATVTGLAEESMASTNLINELRGLQRAQMLALSDAELAFVEQRITNETANTETLVAELDDAIALGLRSRELQASILEFQGSVMEEVGARQEELTELVSQIDDPDERRNLFITNQETLSELLKGIPEYIVSKRRSLETANRLLHLMRQRYEVVQAVIGGDGTTPEAYVRNATQLKSLVDDIVNRRFFDERQLNIDVAQIVVPANSGFARELALTETVDFEVSPAAATEELMRENGFFALWAPNKFREHKNLTLIDVFIGTAYRCTGAQWNRFALEHRGSGVVFRRVAEGSSEVTADIVAGPERLKLQTFFDLASNQSEVDRIIGYWLNDLFQVRRFPRPNGPPNDTTSVLPYLGAPVIGSYRIALQPSDCPFDGAVFTLYVIFASAP